MSGITMPAVRQVYRGNAVLALGAATVTVTPGFTLIPSRAALSFSARAFGGAPPIDAEDWMIHGHIDNATQLTFDRGHTDGQIEIAWEVIQWA